MHRGLIAPLVAAAMLTGGADPRPENAVDGILRAFASHDLVAIGEVHGSAHEHIFLRRLVTDPRFAERVQDIVVEFGNARYQQLADRYVLDGARLPATRVATIWSLTTQRGHAWNEPIYPAFFAAVRRLNRSLPPAKRVRILLGDSPIDWRKIRRYQCDDDPTPSCLDYWLGRRDRDYATVVEGQVLAKHQRALLVAGGYHVIHEPVDGRNATALIEAETGERIFVAVPHQFFAAPDPADAETIESWPIPSLALTAGTWLGDLDARAILPDGVPGARERGESVPVAAIADGYLYLGLLW